MAHAGGSAVQVPETEPGLLTGESAAAFRSGWPAAATIYPDVARSDSALESLAEVRRLIVTHAVLTWLLLLFFFCCSYCRRSAKPSAAANPAGAAAQPASADTTKASFVQRLRDAHERRLHEGDNKCSAEHRHRLRNQAKRFASLTTEPYDLLIPRASWVVTCFYNHFCCQEEIEEICPGTVEDRKAASAGRKRRRGLQKIGGQNEKEACENEKEASS